jgi:hypothetical protein
MLFHDYARTLIELIVRSDVFIVPVCAYSGLVIAVWTASKGITKGYI